MSIVNFLQFNVVTQPDPNNPGNTFIQVQTGPHGLFSGGVIMNLEIGIDSITAQSLQASSIPAPAPIIVQGLVDTGCTITSIDNSIVSALNLQPIGYTNTGTANGVTTVSEHVISLGFPGTKLSGKLIHRVQGINLTGQTIQVLIGRDLMSMWSMTYNGPTGFVSIAD